MVMSNTFCSVEYTNSGAVARVFHHHAPMTIAATTAAVDSIRRRELTGGGAGVFRFANAVDYRIRFARYIRSSAALTSAVMSSASKSAAR